MLVKNILDDKGRSVTTISPSASVREAVDMLAKHKIGAIVVTDDTGGICGIMSERDVVRAISSDGVGILEKPLSNIMTAKVKRCPESANINEVMEIMTEGKFRHLPIEEDGKLVGVVSIGDIVNRKIAEVQREAEDIKAYIAM